MNRIGYILLLIVSCPLIVWGQTTTKVLSQEEMMWFVKQYHPVSVQGKLLLGKGESSVRKAQGAFDPYIHTDLNQKYFDDKTYFSLLNAGLKVPTWYGIELKTGIDQNRGAYLNPENNVPSGGLWYAGISVPVGQGLFIDKRRATLKQAQIFAESTVSEQRKLMNDLYFEAVKQYWKWVEAWNQYDILQESVQLAKTRFEAVKRSYTLGERPAIDTLEAYIQAQTWQMKQNQSFLYYQNNTLELSNFLWYENNTPLEITDSVRPPSIAEISLNALISSDSLNNLLVQLERAHPDMQLYDYKLASMNVEQRLKTEGLKPKVNLNYNALTAPVGSDFSNGLSAENYKWGVSFSLPLFLRAQRGDLQLTKLSIQETELGQQQKLLELKNKVKAYFNEQVNLQNQVALYTDAVNNYGLLLQGERKKFYNGESSLFLVNSRETNLIQARLLLNEMTTKYNIAQMGLLWATGRLYGED